MTEKVRIAASNPEKLAGGGTSCRIKYIDSLKGFAIICVVLGHIALGYTGAASYPGNLSFWHTIENIIYSFHMPLFFAISGFVYYKAYFKSDGKTKYRKLFIQVLNLVAIYIVFVIGFTLIKIPFNSFANEKSGLDDILWMWLNPVGVYWYLYVLVELYLLFAVPKASKMPAWLTLLVCLAFAIAGCYISAPFALSNLMYYAFFFAAGFVSARGVRILSCLPAALSGLFTAAILSIVFWDANELLKDIKYVNIAVSAGLVLALWYLFEHLDVLGSNRLLQYLGKHSLEIYVTHSIVVTAGRTILGKIGLDGQYLCLIINLLLGIGAPLIFSAVIRKLKLFDILFRPATLISRRIEEKTDNKQKHDC